MRSLREKFIKLISSLVARFYLNKGELDELIALKSPTLSSMKNAFLNEVYFKLGLSKGYRLTSVNLEVTNHCNLSCLMCPVNQTMKRAQGYMSLALFKKIIDENPQLEFILPFQWGEPLMHPQIFEMIRYASDRGIRSMMTTNGLLLNEENIDKLFRCGLTRLTISLDGVGEIYEKIRNVPYEKVKQNILALLKKRNEEKASLKIDLNMVVFEMTEGAVEDYRKEWAGVVDRVQVIARLNEKGRERKTPCRELWRGTMVILWDGRVVPCCADYEANLILGDVNKESLLDIWQGEKMKALRRMHHKRTFGKFCRYCDEYETDLVHSRFR